MAIDSTSDLDAVKVEYLDTLDYATANDAALAARNRKAIKFLLLMLPKRASRESESAEWDLEGLRAELATLDAWLLAYGPANPNAVASVKYLTAEGFNRW